MTMNRTATFLAFSVVMVSGPASAQDDNPSLQRHQYVAQMEAEFRALDLDANGVVTAGEIAVSQQNSARAEALSRNRARFAALDINGDGMLDAEEFAKQAVVDSNVDPGSMLTQFDTSGDGVIGLLEYRIVTQERFDRTDRDRDGIVTSEEMRLAGIKP